MSVRSNVERRISEEMASEVERKLYLFRYHLSQDRGGWIHVRPLKR